jgi:hypothetical protein
MDDTVKDRIQDLQELKLAYTQLYRQWNYIANMPVEEINEIGTMRGLKNQANSQEKGYVPLCAACIFNNLH